MKLISCHIENFGKLTNFNYDFKDGINTIKEENGFGKTTFADFIKAMFYGMEVKRNTKNLIDRKKYDPWQGGAFGGNIVFETDNKKYKIERFFSKKEADDTFKLYDLSTNLESTDFSSNIGEELFKINKEAFERSTFISGQNTETSMNDSINAKLGNILENENDINTSDKALKILDEAIKIYKKTGGRGEINEKLAEKTKLEQKLEQSKIDEKNLEERKSKYENIKKQIKNLEEMQENYKKLLGLKIEEEAKTAKVEQYKTLVKNAEESKNNLEQFKNKVDNDTELKEKQKDCEIKLEDLKEKTFSLEKKAKNRKKINIISLVIAILLAIISIIMILMQYKTIGIAVSLVTLIMAVIFVINAFLYNKLRNTYLTQNQEKSNLENLIQTLNSLYEKQEEERKLEFERLKNDYETKIKAIDTYENQNDIQKLLNVSNIQFQNDIDKKEVEEKLKNLSDEINRLNDEKNYNKNQIEIIESVLETVFDTENDLEELNEKIEEMKEKADILEKTKKYLNLAKEQFSSHYLSGMKENFLNNLKLITGKEIEAELDVNLDIKVNELGSNKDLRYFSTGYKDLIYICMRLSLIQALFEDEKPFIILDDPFVNLDENKIENAMNLLRNIEKKYQIIYFICHESRICL